MELLEHLEPSEPFEQLWPEVEAALRMLVRKDGCQPSARSLSALDGLALRSEELPLEVAKKAVALLAELAPALAAAVAGLHPDWPRPGFSRNFLVPLCISLRQGICRYLLHQARDHAEQRIMFRRPLAQQPDVRLRLVAAAAHLAWADFLAAQLNGGDTDDAGALCLLEDILDRACNVLQQICGGTGYMTESAFGQGIRWLNACEQVLRPACVRVAHENGSDFGSHYWMAKFLDPKNRTGPLDRDAMAWLLADWDMSC